MLPTNESDYKKIFTELIKKQMLVLGPDITLAKVKNVSGITVNSNGEVESITGDPQQLLELLINQFVELSGMIVKKTMESILTSYPGLLLAGTKTQVAMGIPVAQDQVAPSEPETVPLHSIPTPAPIAADHAPAAQTLPIEPQPLSVSQKPVDSAPKEDKEPPQFSQNQMDELNKALEQLSKAPLSTEASQK